MPDDLQTVDRSGGPKRRHADESRGLVSDAWGLLAMAGLSCVVALYNGFVLTYSDSGNYLDNAIDLVHLRRPWFFFRPLTYGAFLTPFATPLTLWLLPVVQGLLVAAGVHIALRAASIRLTRAGLVALFAVLCAVTSLPWYTGQLMPDVFTPLVILLSFVLLFAPPGRTPWPAFALLSLAIASHLSHIPLAAVLLAAGLGFRLGTEPGLRSWRAAVPWAVRAAGPLVLAMLVVVAPNYILHRRAVLSRSSSLFALGNLVGRGAAQRYLARACASHPYALCDEREGLRPDVDWFLWSATGPLARARIAMTQGDSTLLREAPALVSGTLRQEWPAVLAGSLRDGIRQVGTFGVHPGEHSFSASVARSMDRLGPAVGRAYRRSRQASGTMPAAGPTRVHYAAVALALLVLAGTLPRLRLPQHRPFGILTGIVLLGVVTNAAVLAGLSTVHPRYQGRVVWLVVLLGLVALHLWRRERRAPVSPSAPGPA